MRGQDASPGKNDTAAVRSNREAQFSRTQAEDGILHIGGIAELEQRIRRADGPCLTEDEFVLIREIVERGLVGFADRGGHLIRDITCLFVRLIEHELWTQ